MTAHVTAAFTTAISPRLASSATARTAPLSDQVPPNKGPHLFRHRITDGATIANDTDPASCLVPAGATSAIRRISFRRVDSHCVVCMLKIGSFGLMLRHHVVNLRIYYDFC